MIPVLRAIQAEPSLELDLIATADHYWPAFGMTVKEIVADGFMPSAVWCPFTNMTDIIANNTHSLTIRWAKDKPDFVLVLGDTGPMLAAATVAAHLNIPVGHIQGGDLTGSIDNKIRYAITAFADYHFPSLPEHAARLIARGVPADNIKVVGPLGIYAMKDAAFLSELAVRTKLGLSDKPIILIIQHPVTSEANEAGEQMRKTLEATKGFPDYEKVIIYPNSDTGSKAIIEAIEEKPLYPKFKSLSYLMFLSLLKYSRVIVGNSSAGLVEAPLFGKPCINIGTRQEGRIGGHYTWNVGYDTGQIRMAIEYAVNHYKVNDCDSPYQTNIDGPAVIIKTIKEALRVG